MNINQKKVGRLIGNKLHQKTKIRQSYKLDKNVPFPQWYRRQLATGSEMCNGIG